MVAQNIAEEQIRSRAYQVFLEQGSQSGHDVDHWVQAEYELMQLPIRRMAGLETHKHKTGSQMLLASLIQAAVSLGAGRLSHLKG